MHWEKSSKHFLKNPHNIFWKIYEYLIKSSKISNLQTFNAFTRNFKSKFTMARKSKLMKATGGSKKARRFKNKQHERVSRVETDKGHKIKRKSKKHQEKSRYIFLVNYKFKNWCVKLNIFITNNKTYILIIL